MAVGMERESEEGNKEFKLKLAPQTPERVQELATQLLYRLEEGGGEAFYEIGISDSGEPVGLSPEQLKDSLSILGQLSELVGASYQLVRVERGERGDVAEVHLIRQRRLNDPVCLNVAFLGNVDAGKSTLKGVLISGELDDGNGKAMERVARYLHEIKSKRTSSVAVHALGFAEDSTPLNSTLLHYNEAEIFLKSAKIAFLIDLAGHERYIRTTLAGLMGHSPDYACLVVSANAGTVGTFKEHLGIALALGLPLFVVLTKIDLSPEEVTKRTLSEIEKYLKLPGVNKIPFLIRSKSDVVTAARNMPHQRVVPIFMISNVTGTGLDALREFFWMLPPRIKWGTKHEAPFLAYVDEKFNVPGVGLVVSGLVEQGRAKSEETLLLGPFYDGSFRKVRVKSIQTNRVFAEEVGAGRDAAFAIAGAGYEEVRKGMALADDALDPKPTWSFRAKVRILHHPTTIRVGYTPVVHSHTIRQAARIASMGMQALRTGDVDVITMRFMQHPELLRPGDTFIFREGRARGLGIVLDVDSR